MRARKDGSLINGSTEKQETELSEEHRSYRAQPREKIRVEAMIYRTLGQQLEP